MEFSKTVRIEDNPPLNRTEKGKRVKIRAKVSFTTKQPFSTWNKNAGEWKQSRYSSCLVNFIGWKSKDGSDPKWMNHVKPGAVLTIHGFYYQSCGKQGDYFDNFEVTEISFPIRAEDGSQNNGSASSQQSAPAPAATPAPAPVAATASTVPDDDIPF